ncbi:hypothetical protein CLAIMM_06385 [Cladophialophora immunda]|nr:hypothetical protein CLAIMM_06385 [Cladophialophora immunda]
MATLDRQGVNRRCGWQKWMDCPHSIYDDAAVRNQYINHTVINSTIPDVTREIFTSGTRTGTVANPLDIQFRAYNLVNNMYVDNNATRAVGRLEVLPSMILNPGYHLVNGLILDAVKGGVGIRNHTVPGGLELGATWTEDILWVLPETRCTNTNLSLHFSVNGNASNSMSGDDGYLRDDGGFSDISPEVPSPRWNDGSAWKDLGSTPPLKRNADILAWWNNQFVAQVLNLTSSEKGDVYTGQFNTFGYLSEPGAIKISSMDGGFLDDIYYKKQPTLESKFENYGTRCSGYYDDDPSVAGKAFMQCGYLYSIPQPEHVNAGQSWRPDPGSPWQQSLYTCASSVAATVKQVTFRTNGSTTFEALQVLDVQDKNYTDPAAGPLPLWGVEKVDSETYKIWDVYKFWGLVDESLQDHPDVDAHRAAKIYLPAAVRGTTLGNHMYDSFAAGGVFTAAWNSIYSYAAALSDVNEDSIPNYSGKSNYGLTLKWRQLMSQSAGGAETLMNLIWTDLIGFAIVGTRTGFEGMGTMASVTEHHQGGNVGLRRAHRYERSIAYGDIRYAIPAFVVGAVFLLTLLASLLMCCVQPRVWAALRHYTRQTSMGRAVTQAMLRGGPDEISPAASTKQWASQARYIILPVPSPSPGAPRTKQITTRNPSSSSTLAEDEEMRPPERRATLKPGYATSRSLSDYNSLRSMISYTPMVEHSANNHRGPSWSPHDSEAHERLTG